MRDEQKFHALKQLGLRSAVVVPIPGRHCVLGVIGFASAKPSNYTATELIFAQDLARRISLALENARLYREAQEANRAKDEFLATLSHELRTPLNAILGWTQILRAKRLDEVTTARAFEAIERNAKAQAELIEDMLDVSRIITGRLRLELQAVRLSEAVEAALDSVRPRRMRGRAIECELRSQRCHLWRQHRLQQIVGIYYRMRWFHGERAGLRQAGLHRRRSKAHDYGYGGGSAGNFCRMYSIASAKRKPWSAAPPAAFAWSVDRQTPRQLHGGV